MALGLIVNKWGILKKPLQLKLKHVRKVFLCATWLHNFCIDKGIIALDRLGNSANEVFAYVPTDITGVDMPGIFMMRNILVQKIVSRGLTRPIYHRNCNR